MFAVVDDTARHKFTQEPQKSSTAFEELHRVGFVLILYTSELMCSLPSEVQMTLQVQCTEIGVSYSGHNDDLWL